MVNLVEAQKPLLHYVIRRAGLQQHTVDVDGAGTVISFWLPKDKVPKDKATMREITPETAGTNKQPAKKQRKLRSRKPLQPDAAAEPKSGQVPSLEGSWLRRWNTAF